MNSALRQSLGPLVAIVVVFRSPLVPLGESALALRAGEPVKHRPDVVRTFRSAHTAGLKACTTAIFSQAEEASTIGRVTDESGAILPGMAVTAASRFPETIRRDRCSWRGWLRHIRGQRGGNE